MKFFSSMCLFYVFCIRLMLPFSSKRLQYNLMDLLSDCTWTEVFQVFRKKKQINSKKTSDQPVIGTFVTFSWPFFFLSSKFGGLHNMLRVWETEHFCLLVIARGCEVWPVVGTSGGVSLWTHPWTQVWFYTVSKEQSRLYFSFLHHLLNDSEQS